jgi:amino acid adenylation domain-containing protein
LSATEEGIWFQQELAPESPHYNVHLAIRITGPLQLDVLQRSFDAMIARHAALRTRVTSRDGRPVREVMAALGIPLEVVAVRDLDHALASVIEDGARPFDLARGPVLRARVLRVSEREHVLSLIVHHIAIDDASAAIVVRELAAGCAARPGLASPDRPAAITAALPIASEDGVARDALAYWKRNLAGFAPPPLPTDRPASELPSYRAGQVAGEASVELTAGLRKLARQARVTPFMVLAAALELAVARLTGGPDVAIGTVISTRGDDPDDAIGLRSNSVTLRAQVAGPLTFRDLLAQIRTTVLGAWDHSATPFEHVVRALDVARSSHRNPLFDVMLTFDTELPAVDAAGGLAFKLLAVAPPWCKYDLSLNASDLRDRIRLVWLYRAERFAPATIERLAARFQRMLEQIVANPELRVEALLEALDASPDDATPDASRGSNGAATGARGELGERSPAAMAARCLHELVAAQAARTPEAIAVRAGDQTLSYRELDARAGVVADHLRARGIGRESKVAVLAERSLELIPLLLGILRAGGAYLPLDPEYPVERLAFMLADAGAALIVCQSGFADRLPPTALPVVPPEQLAAPLARATAAGPAGDPEQIAYIMYTSGSTGVPKGVAVTHAAIARLADPRNLYAPRTDDVYLLMAPLSFDASTFELWVPLLSGATLIVAPPGPLAPHELGALLRTSGVTTLWLTAALFHSIVDGEPEVLDGVPRIVAGGEALSPAHVRRAHDRLPRATLINGYGPTENTVFTTCHLIARHEPMATGVPVGRPVAGTRAYVLDGALHRVPPGIAGELYAAGSGLARGYHGRPGLTAERFVPDPFAPEPGARMYRTGDLARQAPDGTLELLGRIDDQVKIRGHRIEPREIAVCLEAHPEVDEALVVAVERARDRSLDTAPGRELIAYVIAPRAQPETLVAALRAHVRHAMPEYMMPAGFVVLDRFPLGPTGKVDRRALPPPPAPDEHPDAFVEPTTASELGVAEIWCAVLGINRVSIRQDFFDLGGHSLLIAQVAARVKRRFGVELSLRVLFDTRTIEALARRIDAAPRPARAATPPDGAPATAAAPRPASRVVPRRPRHPLSYAQERFWFMDQLEPGKPWFNVQVYFRLRGALRLDALERAIETMVHRHEPLRTRFVIEDNHPRQVVDPEGTPIEVVELAGLDAAERDERAAQLAVEHSLRPFDLSRDVPFRAAIVRFAADDHALLATAHHIALDGWSVPLVLDELGVAYAARAQGRPSALPELAFRYVDFAEWQRDPASNDASARGIAYWTARLGTAPVPAELPLDHKRGVALSGRARLRFHEVSGALRDAANELARREGATLFMVLLAVFKALIYRASGATDIVVGSPIACRTQPELERMIGCFINTIALRTDVSGRPTFRALVQRVRETALGAYEHQDVPFELVTQLTTASRDAGREPLFRLLFALAPPTGDTPGWDGLAVSRIPMPDRDNFAPRWDIGLHWAETPDGLGASVGYNVELFEAETVDRVLRHFNQLLAAALARPDRPIDELDYLTAGELELLVASPPAPGPGELLHELVGAHATRTPDRIAVSGADGARRYGELWQRAGALADQLRARGIAAEDRVAVYLEPSAARVEALLAILGAGGAFVALDPAYRSERLRFIIDDSRARAIITRRRLRDELPEALRDRALCIDDPSQPIAAAPPRPIDPDQLAYVLYTSGSTGVPKAAALSHRAICEQLRWSETYFAIGPDDASLHICSIGFDVAIMEVFAPLVCGARLAIAGAELARDVVGLARFIRDEQVTICAGLIQPLLQALIATPGFDDCRSLRHVVQGGEALSAATRDELLQRSRAVLHNAYGATEIAIDGTCASFGPSDLGTPVSIGREIAGLRVYLLDDALRPVPIGVTGEIYFAGDKLARGYWERPDLTAESFLPSPFTDRPGERMYRTGDLARRRGDGQLEFLGRRDGQVKIRGFRVELGDVEATLSQHPAVREVRVIKTDAEQLAAYVVAGDPCAPDDLRDFVRAHLPPYMVPAAVHLLAALPTLPSGKLDVRALPQQHTAPRTAPGPRLTDPEQRLAALWRDQLEVTEISPHDDFFELGGHSLLLIGLQAAILDAFGRDLSIVDLLAATSLRAMAGLLGDTAPAAVVEPAGATARRDAMQSRRTPRSDAGGDFEDVEDNDRI